MCERRVTAALAALLALSVMGFAEPQQRQINADKQAGKNTANKERPGRTKEGESATPKAVDHAAITGGEIRRTVKGDESSVAHLGMAPSGATVVEFPSSDRYFGVHTSDIGDWVRVEKSPTSRIDSHIVLRPGKDLAPGDVPAIVQVQMRSGVTVTLCIHAVKSAAQHTNRVVIIYDREAVIAARRKAGLAVNLGEESEPQPEGGAVPTQQLAAVSLQPPAPTPANHISAVSPAGEQIEEEKRVDPKTSAALKKVLKDAISDPGSFKAWSGPTHGLSVATRLRDLDDRVSVALVAVKNMGDAPIQILTGQPELVVETVNKGKIIQIKPLEKLSEEASAKSNIIPGRATVYYAVAFAPPILGKQQRVRVTVGRRDVADDPAGANLTAGGAANLDSGVDVDKERRITNGDSVLKPEPTAGTELKSQPARESSMKKIDLVDMTKAALAQALKTTDSFRHWSKEVHGLALSAMPVRDLDGRYQVAVFAIRNNKKRAARLVPGQPEINIETLNDRGRPLTVVTVKKLQESTTAVGDVIPGRAVEYYAAAFATPILGFRQRLRVAVGTTTAADEPAIGVLIR